MRTVVRTCRLCGLDGLAEGRQRRPRDDYRSWRCVVAEENVRPTKFAHLASTAVRAVDRIPTLFWAAWIVGVLLGTAVLAFRVNAPVW